MDENRIGRKALDQNPLDENWVHDHKNNKFKPVESINSMFKLFFISINTLEKKTIFWFIFNFHFKNFE